MHTSLRPFATASVALVGATAIAITPVALTTPPLAVKVASPAVQLSAAVNPITPWLDVFNTAEVNFANLANTWLQAPAPVLQQVIANQIGYLSQLPDFPAIVEQMVANLGAALQTPFAIDLDTLESTNRPLSHRSLFTILQALGDGSPIPPALQPLINFSTTYTSGIVLGLVGPVIGPILALAASASAVVANLTGETPDLAAAFSTIINTPAAMADAFLNGGQTLDLTPVLDALGLDLDPAPGTDVTNVGITFGGLLSPGGSIFNALEFDITIAGRLHVNIPGNGPGFIGSLIGLTNAIAKAIGWDGTGNPLAPPLNTPETPDPNTPATLPQVGDVSILASKTVALETARHALAEKVATADKPVDETATSTDEVTDEVTDETDSVTTPAVSTPAEETTETVDETVDETADETVDETADETAGEAADEAADETADEAKTTKPHLNGNSPRNQLNDSVKKATERLRSIGSNLRNGPKKPSETKTSQSDASSDSSTSKSSDSKSDD